jgi:hypothetical protein
MSSRDLYLNAGTQPTECGNTRYGSCGKNSQINGCASHQRPVRPEAGEVKNKVHSATGADLARISMEYHLDPVNPHARSPRTHTSEGNVVAIDNRKTQPSGPRLLYDRKEAAYQWSISIRAVDYMIAQGRVRTRKIGGRILIPHSELLRIARVDQVEPITSSSSSSSSSSSAAA